MKTQACVALLTLAGALCACADEQASTANISTTSTPVSTSSDMAGKLGAGIIIGEPIGPTVKYWLNDTVALDAAAGWSTHDHTDFYLHSDVLLHKFDIIPVSSGRLPFYIGAGGLLRFRNDHRDNQVGIRIPIGVSYIFDNAPIDVFAEIGPALDVAPSVQGEVTGGVGIRYWF